MPGAEQQDAAWNAAADGGKARRILQESTISLTSSFASSTPATSAKVTGTVSGSIVLVRSSVGTRPVIMRTRTRPAIRTTGNPPRRPCRPALNDCAWRIEADAALGEAAHEGRIRGDVALRRHRLKRRSIATLEEQTLRRHGNGGTRPASTSRRKSVNATDAGVAALWLRNQNGDRQQDNYAEDGACPEQAVSRNSSSEHAGLPYLVADEATTAGKPGCNTDFCGDASSRTEPRRAFNDSSEPPSRVNSDPTII